jgi:hypothetical protein
MISFYTQRDTHQTHLMEIKMYTQNNALRFIQRQENVRTMVDSHSHGTWKLTHYKRNESPI